MRATVQELLKRGVDKFVLTKEPGGPAALFEEWGEPEELRQYFGEFYETGKLVRDLCVNHPAIPQLAKRALFKADSLCNWELIACPAIADGKVVLSDRGWLSDLVYGSVLLNVDASILFDFNIALTPTLPDVSYVILLTTGRDVREQRIASRHADLQNHFDKLGPQVRDKLAQAYKIIIPRYLPEDHFKILTTTWETPTALASIAADFIEEILM
jgi:thymidylate kinase